MNNISERLALLDKDKRELLQRLMKVGGRGTQIPRQKRDRDAFPLSFSQERMWFNHQWAKDTPLYNEAVALHMTGPLQTAWLELSFSEIVRRHEVLRTTVSLVDEVVVQSICQAQPIRIPLFDLQDLPESEREAEVQRLSAQEAQRPFCLSRGPLFRASLLRLFSESHVLLLTFHHIIFDGWSAGILARELFTLYDAFTRQSPYRLDKLPIQYVDYAVWQRARGQRFEQQLASLQQQLADMPALLEWPTDKPRPAVRSGQGAQESFVLDKKLTGALQELSRQEGVTLFMTLLSAFKVLLHRYSRQDDIVVGTAVANRDQSEIKDNIGVFINTLVLRTDLSGDPTCRELLARVRDVTVEAYAHQELPFEKLVEELQPVRDLSRTPLFQVMFDLQKSPTLPVQPQGLTINFLKVHTGTAKFDLSLLMVETEAGLTGELEYNTDLFNAVTIQRMIGHFQRLLTAMVSNPNARVGRLPLLSEAERQQLLVELPDTEVEYPQDQRIHQLFEAQVERTPDAVAVVFGEQQLSYQELNARANQLAHHLMALGVGPEVLVGICIERSIEMVVGLYGILKAGGAYVPLDPTYPKERLAFMLADAQVPVLLTQEKFMAELPQIGHVIALDTELPLGENKTMLVENPVCRVKPDNLAYMIYTSGSTGKPKGAMNSHAGIHNRLLWMQDAYQLTAADRILQKTPFSFDVSVWEFFWPLMFGARLVLARPEGHKDPAYLVDLIARAQITTLHFVPSMLQIFLEAERLDRCRSLKRVICSGEALPFDLQQRFFARLDAELHNLYGPTEAAIDVTFWACDRESKLRIVPIGRPVANTPLYILDCHLQPVPIGVPGELHIGGVQVARGYHNRPQLNKKKFIPSPFGDGRLYKTGDLTRYLPDGNIEFLGRIDYQVKIRGFRIELGEIEIVLGQHPQVRESVVIARADKGDKRLVAYVVPQQRHSLSLIGDWEEKPLTASTLRSYLASRLPEYMVPAAFVILNALPLTPNGKVNRGALPAPDISNLTLKGNFVPPRTPTEELLATSWAEILGLEETNVGIHENFFELGGHSLLATRVISRLRQTFSIELSLRSFFEAPTVAGLAEAITQRQIEQQEPQEIAQLLAKLENMSEEEATQMLLANAMA